MSKKKEENALGLPALVSDTDLGNIGSLTPWSGGRTLTNTERGLLDEASSQKLAISCIFEKTVFGMSQIAEMEQHALATFDDSISFFMDVKYREGRSKEHQAYIDAFTERLSQMSAKHMFGSLELGASGIASIVHSSPYPPPPPSRRRGLLERLLGSGDE
jgi:hypothetical protein